MRQHHKAKSSWGFTIIEVIVVLALVSALLGIATLNLKELVNPAQNGAAELAGFFKEARARAISSTSAYTVEASDARTVVAKYGTTCSDASPVYDNKLTLELPVEVTLKSTTWSVCFNSRGFPDANIVVDLEDAYNEEQSIEVYLGGGVRVH